MYAMTCTCHDVSYDLSIVSLFQDNLGRAHWTLVNNIIKYLQRTKDMFLFLGGKDMLRVSGCSNVSFQTEKKNLFSIWLAISVN